MIIQPRAARGVRGKTLVFVLFISVSSLFFSNAKANTGSWTSGEAPVVVKTETRPGVWSSQCSFDYQKVAGEVSPVVTCMTEGDGVQVNNLPPQVVKIGDDTNVYRVSNGNGITLLPHTKSTLTVNSGVLSIERDIRRSLTKAVHPTTGIVTYQYQRTPDYTFGNASGAWQVERHRYSANGLWAAVQVKDAGLFRINTQTFEVKRFSTDATPVSQGFYLGISDDGKLVMKGGSNIPFTLYEIPDNCGDILTSLSSPVTNEVPVQSPCSSRSMDHLPKDITGGLYAYEFSKDGSEIRYLKTPSPYSGLRPDLPTDVDTWVTIRVPGFEKRSLDYLALGDSFSSGEGDAEWIAGFMRTNHYLPGTNVIGDTSKGIPDERCHISSRSYPFLLGAGMHIPYDRVKSVACSGAVARDDYRISSSYLGQGNRLKELSSGERGQLRNEAIYEFIPGRVQQVEFIEKYRPSGITLTAGGNDAQFSPIITACAGIDTCSYAETAEGKAKVGLAIRQQYMTLINLYRALHNASPQTKIYVAGYPQFFSADSGPCAPNVRLNSAERTMVREAVTYVNDVIEAAAKTVGVKYLDVESSFGGHTLCGEGESYVTGLARSGNLSLDIPANFGTESFHPNALGHKAMSDQIRNSLGQGQTFLTYNNCINPVRVICPNDSTSEPPLPLYFTDAIAQDTTNYRSKAVVPRSYVQKDTVHQFYIDLPGVQPGGSANVKVFSDPIDLGTYTADIEGNVTADISVPSNLAPGMHTLQITTKTYSGEDVTYWQVIEVRGAPGDIDEDGVPDVFEVFTPTPISTVSSPDDRNQTFESKEQNGQGALRSDPQGGERIRSDMEASRDAAVSEFPTKQQSGIFSEYTSNNNWQQLVAVGIITTVCIITFIVGFILRRKYRKG